MIGRDQVIRIGLGALACCCCLCARAQDGAPETAAPAYPILDWQYFGSGGGGYYSFAAAAPSQPSRVYCGIDVGGIYRSDDGGAHWYPIYGALPAAGGPTAPRVYTESSIAISHQNPDVFYVRMDWAGLWKTLDGGHSYARIGPAGIYRERAARPQMLEINPASDRDCVVYALGQFHRTTDGGQTFQAIANPADAATNHSAAAIFYPKDAGDPLLWVGHATLHRSMNGGRTWQKCTMRGWPEGPGHGWNVYLGRVL